MIPKEFTRTRAIIESFDEVVMAKFGEVELSPEEEVQAEYLQNSATGNLWTDDIAFCFEDEYKQFNSSKTFFRGCTYETYLITYERRLAEYLKSNTQSEEFQFIESELHGNHLYLNSKPISQEMGQLIKHSLQRQKDYLINRLFQLGYELIESENNIYQSLNSPTIKIKKILQSHFTIENLDAEENLRAGEKIIYLHALGILDYLKSLTPFVSSTNILANVLSGIIEEKTSTIQSYVNPIYNAGTDQKNNPLKNQNTLAKVNLRLTEIGFKKR